jgi:hypothetical protein
MRFQDVLEWLGPGRVQMLAGAVVVALLSSVLTAVLVSGEDEIGAGEARLLPDGRVLVSHDGGEFAEAADDTTLGSGDRVRVASGSAVLELDDGATAELRRGSQVAIGAVTAADLRLEGGDLLLEVEKSQVEVDGGSAGITAGAGAFKLRRSTSLVAGSYRGGLLLTGAGASLTVPAFREAAVAGTGTLPQDPRALQIDEDDAWDRKILGEVLDLDRRLLAFGRGFEAQLDEGAATDPSLYESLLPGLAPSPLSADLLAGRSAGENLLGLVIVDLSDGPFETVFEEVFDFRALGARWGLVAADQELRSRRVVSSVEAAIGRAPLEIAAPEAPAGDGGTGGTGTGGGDDDDVVAQPPTSTTGPGNGGTTSTTDPGNGGGGSTTTTTSLITVPPPPTTTTTRPGGGPGPTTTTTACPPLDQLLGLC